MPLAPIAAIASIIGGAATAATSIYGAVNQPDTPKPAAPVATGPSVGQTQAALAPQALTIESLTGGSVSPDYLASIAPTLAGVAGQPNTGVAMQNVLKQILGTGNTPSPTSPTPSVGAPGAPTFTPTGMPINLAALATSPGASDFLTKLAGGLS